MLSRRRGGDGKGEGGRWEREGEEGERERLTDRPVNSPQ